MSSDPSARIGAARRIRQREIAARSGVSVSTVSRVLNNTSTVSDDVQQRVLAAAAELGYWDGLPRQRRTLQHIGLLITKPPDQPFVDPFHSDICTGVEAECRRQGVHCTYTTVETGTQSAVVLDRVGYTRIDGLVLLAVDDRALIEAVLATGLPAVLINAEHPGVAIDTFLPDNQLGPTLAVQHLIAYGHRRILYVTRLQRRTIQRRHAAYRAALEGAGIPYDPALVFDIPPRKSGGAHTAAEALQAWLARRPRDFTAVLCTTAAMAPWVMRVLSEEGYRIPEDVSVVGYDDLATTAFLSPPLTTVRIEREELGALAVRRLLERAATPALTPIRVELATRLIERESVAPARG
jgi:DNA-binding LacI/PurR family transcriptional regulator